MSRPLGGVNGGDVNGGDMAEHEFDLRGFRCPLPVLKLRVRLRPLAPGTVVTVLTDDPLAGIDVPHFCTEAGHRLVEARETGEGHAFTVERGSDQG